MKIAYRILVGKPVGKRRLGKPRRKLDNIKINLNEIVYDGVDWINLAQRWGKWRFLLNTIMNIH
jgi:hypothetical protein